MPSPQPLLIISRHAPDQGTGPRAALHAALTAASLDMPVRLLLLGAGVRQLFTDEAPAALAFRRELDQIALFDGIELLVESSDGGPCQTPTDLPATAMTTAVLADMIRQANTVLCY